MHYLDRHAADRLGLQQSGPLRVPGRIRRHLLQAHAGTARLPDSVARLGNHGLHEHRWRHLRTALRLGDGGLLYDRNLHNREDGLLRLHQQPLAVCKRRGVAAAVGQSLGVSEEAHQVPL